VLITLLTARLLKPEHCWITHHQHLNFISEQLVHSLSLPRTNQSIHVSGIGGIYHNPPIQSVTRFQLSSLQPSGRKIDVTAVVVPKVTCDLPLKPVTLKSVGCTSQISPWTILDLVNPVELASFIGVKCLISVGELVRHTKI